MHVAITGASSGIGEALARHYLTAGAAVTMVARRTERLSALTRELGGVSCAITADLSDVDHACAWLTESQAALGPIDVLINNAGASMVHHTVSTDWTSAERLLRLNLMTPLKLTSALLPAMVARGSGCIVDIASVAALSPQPGFFFYNASKAGLVGASESLRAELRQHGVHVVTVYPGPIHTPMGEANFRVFDPAVARLTPTGDVHVLAQRIARAVEKKRPRVVYPRIYSGARWFPWLARWLVDRATPPMKRPRTTLQFEATEGQGS